MGTQAELWARWAALCQPRQQHVASEQVPIRLRRINLYSPVFAGPGVLRAPGVPLPRAAVLLQLPCQRLHNLPSILIRFSTSPSPAHSSPNAGGAGRSHDMVSNQLLNSDFSWLSLEEASRSLCLVLPEQGAALWLPLMPRWPAMPVPLGSEWLSAVRGGGRETLQETRCCLEPGTCTRITSTHRPCHALAGCEPEPGPAGAGAAAWRGGAVPLLLFSWGSLCVAPAGPGGWCGSWAPCPACPSWHSSAAAGASLGLAPSPAPGPRRQRVVALSEARGCKHFPALPSPN